METTKTMTLEDQIKELQAQIDFLKTKWVSTSTTKRLQEIRLARRAEHFGTREDIMKGKAEYGPEKKRYSDYDAIRDITVRTTDLLFRYSRGLSNGGTLITSLIQTEEDIKDYEKICDKVCRGLKEMILEESAHPQQGKAGEKEGWI